MEAHPATKAKRLVQTPPKSDVSYSGQYYTLEEGRRIAREATEFIRRAEEMLAARP